MKQQGQSSSESFPRVAWLAILLGCVLTSVVGGAGCGRKSGLIMSQADAATAVGSGSGGVVASGGVVIPDSTGASGGVASPGGAVASGGAIDTGGRSASGGTSGTGGRSASSGTSGSGGRSASGGTSGSGGRSAGGGASGTGGTMGSAGASGVDAGSALRDAPSLDTSGSDATGIAILDSDFCTGNVPKVSYQGQSLSPLATNYRSDVAFAWGLAFGLNLRTTESLGFDLQIEVMVGVGLKAGNHIVGPYAPLSATVRASGEPSQNGHHVVGTVRLGENPLGSRGAQAGLCLEVDEAGSALLGARIYLPDVMLEPDDPWRKRLQIFLLADATLTSHDVATRDLSSLALAATPLIDLSEVAFYEQKAGRLGFNPGQKIGERLRTKLGRPSLSGLPFILVADDERVCLGSFMTGISSVSSVGPTVTVEDITGDGFLLTPPWGSTLSPDPRNDPRFVKVLTETGKLLP